MPYFALVFVLQRAAFCRPFFVAFVLRLLFCLLPLSLPLLYAFAYCLCPYNMPFFMPYFWVALAQLKSIMQLERKAQRAKCPVLQKAQFKPVFCLILCPALPCYCLCFLKLKTNVKTTKKAIF